MFYKLFVFTVGCVLSLFAYAHDGAHGPRVKKQGKYGGKMASVILKKDHDNSEAKAQYIAELTLSNEGMLRVYFYDTDLQPTTFDAKAITGTLVSKNKIKQNSSNTQLVFTLNGNSFEAKVDPSTSRAAGLELVISTTSNDYLADFARIK